MDRYIYIKSNQSDDYFSENKVYKFKVHLNTPLNFDGFWKVALVELHAEQDKKIKVKNTNTLIITTDICEESTVFKTECPILRCLWKNSSIGWDYQFDTPFYIPIRKKEIIEFEISISNDEGHFASFLKEPLYMTLHFKHYPFYTSYESF